VDRRARIDSEGRVAIPRKLRKYLGGRVVIRKTEQGVLLVPAKDEDFAADFLNVVEKGLKGRGCPSFPVLKR